MHMIIDMYMRVLIWVVRLYMFGLLWCLSREKKQERCIPMNISHNSYRSLYLLHVGLIYQHLTHVLAEVLDGVLTEQLTSGQLLDALVQVQSHGGWCRFGQGVRVREYSPEEKSLVVR